jgi:hypothetical protein
LTPCRWWRDGEEIDGLWSWYRLSSSDNQRTLRVKKLTDKTVGRWAQSTEKKVGGGGSQPRKVDQSDEDIVFLCTGASFYAPYSLLLISNKFCMGGMVGSRWGRGEGAKLEGENKRGRGGE